MGSLLELVPQTVGVPGVPMMSCLDHSNDGLAAATILGIHIPKLSSKWSPQGHGCVSSQLPAMQMQCWWD